MVTSLPSKLRAMLLVATWLVLCSPAWISAGCTESLQAALHCSCSHLHASALQPRSTLTSLCPSSTPMPLQAALH